jgi:maleylpyruvate isomerase
VIRLRELEVHHADLALGYELSDIPADVLEILLEDVTGHLLSTHAAPDLELRDERGDLVLAHETGGPVVRGRRSDLLAWLTGRSPGTGLGPQPLPVLPPWI